MSNTNRAFILNFKPNGSFISPEGACVWALFVAKFFGTQEEALDFIQANRYNPSDMNIKEVGVLE